MYLVGTMDRHTLPRKLEYWFQILILRQILECLVESLEITRIAPDFTHPVCLLPAISRCCIVAGLSAVDLPSVLAKEGAAPYTAFFDEV